MKKTISLKVGDPVTCMRRYYAGNPYHGQIQRISDMYINVGFDDGAFNYLRHGGHLSDEPCSLIPGHIEPEPLALPETVEFEKGDRVLAWNVYVSAREATKVPGIYQGYNKYGHLVRLTTGIISGYHHVEPFTEAALYAQFHEPEQPTQPEQPAPVEPDETPKEGDWCLFWDEPDKVITLKMYKEMYGILSEYKHVDVNSAIWKHARKLKPSDLSPELWAIIKNEEQ